MKSLLEVVLNSSRATFSIIAFALFFPLFFHGNHFGVPWVKGGDEPHYLVIINSFINDGDFDLRNNYESALMGSDQAGHKFAGKALDRHIEVHYQGRLLGWPEICESPSIWPVDSQGHPVPLLKKGIPPEILELPEYPGRPLGIAFVLGPFLWLARGTRFVEPLALFLAFAAVFGTAFLFHRLCLRYCRSQAANLAVLLVCLASPMWMYARSFFTEPFLAFFAMAAYVVFIEKRSGFWVGLFLGLGGLMKPNFMLLVLPPAYWLFFERRWKDLLLLTIGPFVASAVFLYFNYRFNGSPFVSAEYVTFGNPLAEFLYLFFSWNHGVLVFSPITVYCLLKWKKYYAEQRADALLLGWGFFLYFSVVICIWTGGWGWCFGPRHIIPVLPFLMVPMTHLYEDYQRYKPWVRRLVLVAIAISVFVNFFGALDGYWDSNPLTILAGHIAP